MRLEAGWYRPRTAIGLSIYVVFVGIQTLSAGIVGDRMGPRAEAVFYQEDEKLKQALNYRPTQKSVDYYQPSEADMAGVRLDNASVIGQTGFIVRGSDQRLLRRFVDTTGNRKIDTWAYYANGFEIYRDQDTNADGKPDRFQWLGPAGTRIGIDSDEDLVIDRWERISAQELSQMVVEAVAAKSPERLEALLLDSEELASLKLAPGMARRVSERLKQTAKKLSDKTAFEDWPANLKWLHFSASYPGAVESAASDAATTAEPIEVYDFASTIIEVQSESKQLMLGSLVRVGTAWRLLDFPAIAGQPAAAQIGGVFFQTDGMAGSLASNEMSTEGLDPELLTSYQSAEEALREAVGVRTGPALAILHQRRAQALWQVVLAARGAEREPWLRQYVDVVTSAYQMDEFPAGLSNLESQIEEMRKENFDSDLIAYAEFRQMNAWYSRATETEEDVDKVQDQWQKRLANFVDRYPNSLLAAEAMFQLANIDDYLGDVEAAAAVYRRIATEFPDAPLASRAKGAVIRLTSVGKPLPFRGTTLDGKAFSLDQLKGKSVLIHYWATWCEPCKAEFDELKELHAKYAKEGFEIVSVSLDESKADVADYLKSERLPWLHLYAEGGLESSPLASQLGVIALPTMILIGPDGTVVDRGIGMPQMERELRKLMR